MKQAVNALRKLDPELVPLLDAFQIEDLKPETDYYRSLTRAIIYQQLSGKAAKTISNRFIALYGGWETLVVRKLLLQSLVTISMPGKHISWK